MPRTALALAVLWTLAACGSDPVAVLCTAEARPGVIVEVRDAVTGAAAAAGTVLTLTDGAFQEVVDQTTVLGLNLWGATERPGTYEVRVEKDGYKTWRREDVVVALTPDGCHVVTVALEADLEPIG